MNILMLLHAFLLILVSSISFAKEENKNSSRPVPSKIQYAGEDNDQQENNSIYGSSDSFNPYGGLPNSYGGFIVPQEILRNRFRGSDSSSQDQDNGYQNEQSSSGSGIPYPGSRDGNEVPNGVFTNPFLGQRRRTFSIPTYGGSDGGSEPGYGGGSEPGYGGGSYLGGRYTPTYRPSIYQTPSVFSPGAGQGFIYPIADRGYVYPLVGAGGIGVGQRQPYNPYGYGIGNGYGLYPGTMRNIPTIYLPASRGNNVYGEIPRGGYGPALFGNGQYPELAYPGMGFEYGRLNESNPRGDQSSGNVVPQGAGLPYPQSTQSSEPSNQSPERKAKSTRREDP